MPNNIILQKVLDILEKEIGISKEYLTENYFKEPLTGDRFGLTAMELVYLFYLVEETFRCQISGNLIDNYEFNTILGIVDVINKAETQYGQI